MAAIFFHNEVKRPLFPTLPNNLHGRRLIADMLKIAIILGSIREGRQTHHVANYLGERLNASGQAAARVLDLEEYDLPILTNRWRQQSDPAPGQPDFSRALFESDGIVLASPEYHGSYTGVLKNALDHFWQEFNRKPMAVVATGSGRFGGINASSEMQQLILSLGAFAMPHKLLVPHVNKVFDEAGQPIDEAFVRAAAAFIEELLWFTEAISSARQRSGK